MTRKRTYIVFLTCIIALYCCKDKWDDHFNLNSSQNSNNLLQQIKTMPELSKFYDYLVQTGYQNILGSSEFTIWAPTNDALANIDAAILSDTTKLKQFVGNHISYHAYYNDTPDSFLRIPMLNGKYITIYKNSQSVEGSNLIAPNDRPCRNGVIHVIDKYIVSKPNIHEYLQTQNQDLEQVYFLKLLDKQVIDLDKSTRKGVDSKGNTIYDTVWTNSSPFLKNIANIDDENQQFTFILLTNNAFEQGFGVLRPYSVMSSAIQWDSLTAINVCADLAIKGKFTTDNWPGTFTSTTGTLLNIDASSIISSTDLSNGTVVVLDQYPVQLANKLKPIIIEGENATGRKFSGSTDFKNIVQRYDALASGQTNMVYNLGSGKAIWGQFTANNIYAATYRFYWVAPNYTYDAKDANTTTANLVDTMISSFGQILSLYPINSSTVLTSFPQKSTSPVDTTLQYLGSYTFTSFTKAISLRVTGVTMKATTIPKSTSTPTTTFATPISVDYIKMVPVIQ